MKSARALPVKYGLPAMFTVVCQPFLRQRQAVTWEIPASSQNLCRLNMGLPSTLEANVVFTNSFYKCRAGRKGACLWLGCTNVYILHPDAPIAGQIDI
jgi:hypothetical protein